MFNRDIIEKRFHNSIPEEDLKTFSGRLKGLIGMMGEMFPRSKVVWINMHPLNNVDLGAKHNWGGGYFQPPLDRSVDSVLFPPLFSQRRLAQHAQALRLAAEEEGVDSLDVSNNLATSGRYISTSGLTQITRSTTKIVLETKRLVQLGRLLGAQRPCTPGRRASDRHGRDDAGKAAPMVRVRSIAFSRIISMFPKGPKIVL